MYTQEPLPKKMIDDARELYVKYEGREFSRIEREMRALGWERFRRERLYTRRHRYAVTPGWPERFGWRELLKGGEAAVATGRHEFERWLRSTFPDPRSRLAKPRRGGQAVARPRPVDR